MSHSYLDSTHLEFLASHTSTVGRLACLAAWLGTGKGLIQRIGKLKNKQKEGKLPAPIGPLKTSVVTTRCLAGGQARQQGDRNVICHEERGKEQGRKEGVGTLISNIIIFLRRRRIGEK